jgi:transposase
VEAPADSPSLNDAGAELQTAEAAVRMAPVNRLAPNDTIATQPAAVAPGDELPPHRVGEVTSTQTPKPGYTKNPADGSAKSWTRHTTRTIRIRINKVFGIEVCAETVRRLLKRLGLSWKKAKKILAKANTEARRAFVADIRALLDRATHDENLVLAYIDEGHVHQDADMGYGWSPRGQRLYVASSSPGLKAKVSFYGIYLYSESQTRIWPYPRANGEHTIDVLERLRAEFQARPMIVIWDGASYHRAACVFEAAARLGIQLVRLPAYSPDFMPVEALWRWLRESVTYNHCHDTAAELVARVAAFVLEINQDACALADRLWVKDELDPDEEKLRFSA